MWLLSSFVTMYICFCYFWLLLLISIHFILRRISRISNILVKTNIFWMTLCLCWKAAVSLIELYLSETAGGSRTGGSLSQVHFPAERLWGMSRGEKCSSGRMRSSTRFTYFFLYRLIKKEKVAPMSFCEGRESSLFLPGFSLLLYFFVCK